MPLSGESLVGSLLYANDPEYAQHFKYMHQQISHDFTKGSHGLPTALRAYGVCVDAPSNKAEYRFGASSVCLASTKDTSTVDAVLDNSKADAAPRTWITRGVGRAAGCWEVGWVRGSVGRSTGYLEVRINIWHRGSRPRWEGGHLRHTPVAKPFRRMPARSWSTSRRSSP